MRNSPPTIIMRRARLDGRQKQRSGFPAPIDVLKLVVIGAGLVGLGTAYAHEIARRAALLSNGRLRTDDLDLLATG